MDKEKDVNKLIGSAGMGLNRREFGKLVGITSVGLLFAPSLMRSALAATNETPSAIIQGKAQQMIIHNAALGVMETPLTLLREHYITPVDMIYSRMHFPVSGSRAWIATTQPTDFKSWSIDISGLVDNPRTVSLDDIKKMEQTKLAAVMQCAGNGRAYFAAKAKCPGGQWHHGGMANLEWEGVPLRPFLQQLDLGVSPDVRYITANGADNPPVKRGQDLIKSYHIDDPALDNAILALKMNGEPIPAIHGGPVRLIIPGFYGNMNVKFVNQLLFETEQSPSAFQSRAYRVPDKLVQPNQKPPFQFTVENSVPTYNFKIMSVIFSPLPEDSVKSGNVTMQGVAWNDGTVPIEQIEISTDGGHSWQEAKIDKPRSSFAWYKWNREVSLKKGTHELLVKATDAKGETQPMDGTVLWNPKGYQWNGVDHVKVTVT
jgi:sulfite oxidase